ncbi:TPA: hypothetical protein VK231_001066 [Streptococcus pyogenes]|uniref:Phage protein n=1 Tax=Streptococcus canis FSL Z3-227 TaxID=482234 RepID=A0AAV3FRD1_STRCB|nr:hypothetical protein [Streptococcus canis]QBX32124.1 hypothetical protein Javan94_0033 [Streptococcus phage Javan94]HER5315475.1 hypothetical protein [Streptococcus pyogenes]EIQ81499.1 hypothetical protein SCAZ3_03705 [Streptococcus canis FSL Z3-227]MDV5994466.1 hypothetical protein [Streptococcus canis]MDV6023031.1 hypothetical protein [Streptococcus canis]
MNKISLNVEITWENKEEFQQIMNKVDETKEAYEKALEAAEKFVPKMSCATKLNKGESNE